MFLFQNYEVSKRTSMSYPYAHKDGSTIFIPINIVECSASEIVANSDETEDTDNSIGYKFDEYRFNKGAKLPEDAVEAIIEAFIQDEEALAALGM